MLHNPYLVSPLTFIHGVNILFFFLVVRFDFRGRELPRDVGRFLAIAAQPGIRRIQGEREKVPEKGTEKKNLPFKAGFLSGKMTIKRKERRESERLTVSG